MSEVEGVKKMRFRGCFAGHGITGQCKTFHLLSFVGKKPDSTCFSASEHRADCVSILLEESKSRLGYVHEAANQYPNVWLHKLVFISCPQMHRP